MRMGTLALVSGLLISIVSPWAQTVPRDRIDGYLAEGDLEKAEQTIQALLAKPMELSYQDSTYLLKNLSVLYASNPDKQAKADLLFKVLLELDPFASLYDTFASNAILNRFQKIRREFQQRKGGKTLVPPLVVFDFQGFGFTPEERINLTNQFIGEMEKISVFHTLDRPSVTETFRRLHKQPETCQDRDCRLDICRRLMAEYMVMGEVARIDSVFTFQLVLVDVETGQNRSVLRKVYTGQLIQVLATDLADLARALQDQEAAWLNLTVQPANTSLSLDGTPLAASERRFPVNPGKHTVCGVSPGYQTVCRDFQAKKLDAVTYSFILPRLGSGKENGSSVQTRANWEDELRDPSDDANSGKQPSKKTITLVLGGMAAVAIALAVFWGTNK